jgi:hypothetical protein
VTNVTSTGTRNLWLFGGFFMPLRMCEIADFFCVLSTSRV